MVDGRVCAFFDIDHTIIEVNSGRLWLRHLWKTKKIGVGQALQAMLWLTQYLNPPTCSITPRTFGACTLSQWSKNLS